MAHVTASAPLPTLLLGAVLSLSAGGILAADQQADAAPDEFLEFAVYLDSREIGTHRFSFTPLEDGYRLLSEASYDVRILFINAYRYRHRSEELWRDGCLFAIDAHTDANGEDFQVAGQRGDDGMVLETLDGALSVDSDCPRTFAYWDRELLAASDRLVNSQTGEVAEVSLAPLDREALPWEGDREARAFVLRNPEADVYLWYDDDDRWLGLRSVLDNGRTLSYRLSDGALDTALLASRASADDSQGEATP